MPKWQQEHLDTSLGNHQFFTQNLQEIDLTNIQDAQIISVFIQDAVSAKVIAKLPNLKLIVTRSTGFDHIDLEEAKKHDILVENIPGYGSNTVAEHGVALLLALTKNISKINFRTKNQNFEYLDTLGIDLHQKTIGIIGSGRIGKNMIQIAKGFDMDILVYDVIKDDFLAEALDFKYVDLDFLLQNSDVLSLHLPLLPETKHILNQAKFKLVKPGSFLINAARGELISNQDLAWALEQGIFKGVGLDTLEGENEMFKNGANELQLKIINDERVIYTPHSAYYTEEALQRILDQTIQNIIDFQNGKESNVVG
jgi:D-lactate dehydrogenase